MKGQVGMHYNMLASHAVVHHDLAKANHSLLLIPSTTVCLSFFIRSRQQPPLPLC